jgi:hypothetical protein
MSLHKKRINIGGHEYHVVPQVLWIRISHYLEGLAEVSQYERNHHQGNGDAEAEALHCEILHHNQE